ncbi:hypothetical protein C2G38_2162644 [Gigaspora rosea]|uniref:Uncharacterized protein n=1 Tax=Gigaspora rosea TaxID=44941 RepID=A0A397VY37_9GLOM|nr:hypothetical protein C2G38_2162644 [Gigaspora rosea]
MATPMLILSIAYDQDGNAERTELVARLALKLSKLHLIVVSTTGSTLTISSL